MMMDCQDNELTERLRAAAKLWWFLDYDGTLADFAPNPDIIRPDLELIGLVTALAVRDDMRVTIISGRRLAHIERLLPVNGIIKAGSYGLEIRLPSGELVHTVELDAVRPVLDSLKEQWQKLLAGREGFYLEDKGWTLAIHAKDAEPAEAAGIIDRARRFAEQTTRDDQDRFQLLDGDRFLELGPRLASKRRTVEHLFAQYSWPGALPVYLGDDDKDAVAFAAVQERGGFAVAVGDRLLDGSADCRLPSPAACRRWLSTFVDDALT